MAATGSVRWSAAALALLAAAVTVPPTTRAQSAAPFYKDRTIDLYIWTSVGGAYDTYARILARHMPRHIPGGPQIVPRNMIGAAGVKLTGFLYSGAPRDGTAIGTIARGNAFDPLVGVPGATWDGRQFNWLGSTNNEVSVCVTWHTSGVATFEEARSRELIVGATGATADSYQYPKIVNAVLGTRFKIISGYAGGNEVDLAMERGEVQGRCAWSWTSVKGLKPKWLAERKINILYQMGLTRHADLPHVPLIIDLARNDEERLMLRYMFVRQVMAWPYIAPPGVPTDRVEQLRTAFMATMRDSAFLADAAAASLEITPVSGAELQRLVAEIYATPAHIAQRVAELIR